MKNKRVARWPPNRSHDDPQEIPNMTPTRAPMRPAGIRNRTRAKDQTAPRTGTRTRHLVPSLATSLSPPTISFHHHDRLRQLHQLSARRSRSRFSGSRRPPSLASGSFCHSPQPARPEDFRVGILQRLDAEWRPQRRTDLEGVCRLQEALP